MKAKSIQAKQTVDIAEKLVRAIADGFSPTLAFVFISVEDQVESTMSLMRSHDIEVFGAFSAGEFTEEGMQDDGISILLLDINPEYFRLKIFDLESISTIDASRKIGEAGIKYFTNPGFIVSAADLSTPGEFIIQGITQTASHDATIIGGISGEPVFFKGVVFTNNLSFKKGLIGLVLDQDKIEIQGMAIAGWKSVGTQKTVTKADQSWVREIDGSPALDILRKFMGEDVVLNETVGADHIARLNINFPLQVERKSGYSVMRPTLLANLEEKSIFCGGIIEEGDVFRFSIPPDFDIIDTVIESSREIKKVSLPDIDAMVIFSCAGRFIDLGPMIETELDGLAETWGSPMAGFLCLGEFGKVQGAYVSEFHGSTCSWLALKEK